MQVCILQEAGNGFPNRAVGEQSRMPEPRCSHQRSIRVFGGEHRRGVKRSLQILDVMNHEQIGDPEIGVRPPGQPRPAIGTNEILESGSEPPRGPREELSTLREDTDRPVDVENRGYENRPLREPVVESHERSHRSKRVSNHTRWLTDGFHQRSQGRRHLESVGL